MVDLVRQYAVGFVGWVGMMGLGLEMRGAEDCNRRFYVVVFLKAVIFCCIVSLLARRG